MQNKQYISARKYAKLHGLNPSRVLSWVRRGHFGDHAITEHIEQVRYRIDSHAPIPEVRAYSNFRNKKRTE